jgi:phosphoglycolate phosphatase-like HAD superfamily hydrolase
LPGVAASAFLLLALHGSAHAQAARALPSWNDGAARSQILAFVRAVTDEKGKDYVAPAERIAVFDNDGTLWGEQPMYYQLVFALDRVKQLAPKHPEWNDREPFTSALAGDLKGVAATGEKGLLELIAASHAGNTTEEFATIVRRWLTEARHPTLGRAYTTMVYQPMLELLAYLRANGFKTFIVSGGGVEFLRVFAEQVYGVPPEQVVGSSIQVKYESDAKSPKLQRLPELNFIDDKAGKPVGIHYHIGRRPIAAFGNSDGDFEMLEWTTTGPGRRLGLIVHHDDAEREYAYDRESHVGRLARALEAAPQRGWTVVSVKNDWARVYPPLR